jgi:hypothetical protein
LAGGDVHRSQGAGTRAQCLTFHATAVFCVKAVHPSSINVSKIRFSLHLGLLTVRMGA